MAASWTVVVDDGHGVVSGFPYYVLMAAIIQLGFRVGVPVLEGGRHDPAFKVRFGMMPQPLQAFTSYA